MKRIVQVLLCCFVVISVTAQTVWTGSKITFSKASFADFNLSENQDRITDSVWITRANSKGLFNIFSESSYQDIHSPAGTEWAFGVASAWDTLAFNNWEETVGSPPSSVNQNMVLHIISEDIYIDIKFTSWVSGKQGGGGGFSYERSTMATSINEVTGDPISLFPNPASGFIQIAGLNGNTSVTIYDILGMKMFEGLVENHQKIDVKSWKEEIYFILIQDKTVVKFRKY